MQSFKCTGRVLQVGGPCVPHVFRKHSYSVARKTTHTRRSQWPTSRIFSEPDQAPNEQNQDPEEGVLLPEEDWVVPGGYQDSLSKNTKLGRAVDDACKELETLGQLEKESLQKANDLLKKLGYRGDLTAPETQEPPSESK